MLENIISSASNQSEKRCLQIASDLGLRTGGWSESAAESIGTKKALRLAPDEIDEDNILSGDVTLLICSTAAVAASPNRWRTLLVNQAYRPFIKVDVHQEPISIALDCQRRNAHVLNIVVIEDPSREFFDDLEKFIEGFLKSFSGLYTKNAGPKWCKENRRTNLRKTNFGSAWSAYFHTKDELYLHAIEREVLRDSFSLLCRLPIAPSTLSRFTDMTKITIRDEFSKLKQRWEDTNRNVFSKLVQGSEDTNQYEQWLHECIAKSLQPKTKVSHRPVTGNPLDVLNDLFDSYDEGNEHWDLDYIKCNLLFTDACNVLANTERRGERQLRTMGLLILGGIVPSRDREAWEIIKNARGKNERIRTSYSIDQLNLRFESIGGWSGLEELGKSFHYGSDKDDFLLLAQRYPSKEVYEQQELLNSLFYFADAFRTDRRLWTVPAVTSFARWTTAVCGNSPERWQTWIGPPRRSNSLT